jgi:hypothetical protein
VIWLGVLIVRCDKISKCILWTLAPKHDMPLNMILVGILSAIRTASYKNWFAIPDIAICTEDVVIPALGFGILFKGDRPKCPPEYFL